jgi:hypothetical protein
MSATTLVRIDKEVGDPKFISGYQHEHWAYIEKDLGQGEEVNIIKNLN